jgi:hypothetical protein
MSKTIRHKRLILLVVAVIVIALLAGTPTLFRRVQAIRSYERCLEFEPPANHAGYIVYRWNKPHDDPTSEPIFLPDILSELPPKHYMGIYEGLVLLHGLHFPGGKPQLVMIGAYRNDLVDPAVRFYYRTVAPITSPLQAIPDRFLAQGDCGHISVSSDDTTDTTVFCGHVDSTDPGRFTFEISRNGQRHAIHGVLDQNGKIRLVEAEQSTGSIEFRQ